MPDTTALDFQQILSQPTLAYAEGLRFFRGVGLINDTLRQLARDLDARNIAYSVVEAIALNQHGYKRYEGASAGRGNQNDTEIVRTNMERRRRTASGGFSPEEFLRFVFSGYRMCVKTNNSTLCAVQ